jgi:5-deoxy-D-glucuronate isomerase
MERLIKAHKNGKFQQIVAPGTMRFLDFATLQMDHGDRHSFNTGSREYVLDIFSGAITLVIGTVGHSKAIYTKIGKRADVFSGPPVILMVSPMSSSWKIATRCSCRRDITPSSPPLATNCNTPGCWPVKNGNMEPGRMTRATLG